MTWNGKEHPCIQTNGFYWCFFSKKNEPEAWHFMGSIYHFVNNSNYKLTNVGVV